MRDLEVGIEDMRRVALKGARVGITKAAVMLLYDAVMETPTVPLAKHGGRLRESGSVFVQGELVKTSPQTTGKGTPLLSLTMEQAIQIIEAVVGFNTPYAARQHEGVGFHFTEPGSGAKFLETPAAGNTKKYGKVVEQSINAALRAEFGAGVATFSFGGAA